MLGKGGRINPGDRLLQEEEGGEGQALELCLQHYSTNGTRRHMLWPQKFSAGASSIYLLVDARVVDPQVELARLAPYPLRQLLNRVANLDGSDWRGSRSRRVIGKANTQNDNFAIMFVCVINEEMGHPCAVWFQLGHLLSGGIGFFLPSSKKSFVLTRNHGTR